MKFKQPSRILGLVIIIFCLVLLFFIIPTQIKGKDAALFPRLITILFAIPGVLLIASRKEILERSSNKTYDIKGIIRVIVTAFVFAIYLIIVRFIGFFTSSFLVIIVLMAYYGVRSWRKFILIPGAFLLLIYFVIEWFLGFPLPDGWFF